MRPILGIALIVTLVAALAVMAGQGNRPADQPASGFDPAQPAFVKAETVLCPEMTVFGAYLDGRQYDGDSGGKARVAELFLHAGDDCVRTFGRDPVELIEHKPNSLAKVRWEKGLGPFLVQPWKLEN